VLERHTDAYRASETLLAATSYANGQIRALGLKSREWGNKKQHM